jgi:hypothetical protein
LNDSGIQLIAKPKYSKGQSAINANHFIALLSFTLYHRFAVSEKMPNFASLFERYKAP